MKYLIVLGIGFVLLFPPMAQAQESGTWDISLFTSPAEGSLVPSVGYFFYDNLEVMASVGFSTLSTNSKLTNVDTDLIAGTFSTDLVYHFRRPEAPVGFMVMGGFGVLHVKTDNGSKIEDTLTVISIGPGIQIYSGPGALNLLLLYQTGRMWQEQNNLDVVDSDVRGFNFLIGYSLYF